VYNPGNGKLQEKMPEKIVLIDDLLSELKMDQNQVLFVGDDVDIFRSTIESKLGDQARFAPPTFYLPRASNLGVLALQKWFQSNKSENHDFAPNYLQLTLAEKNLLGRLT
jgi:tRNA threonylcarbamoyladenosine biosynthesis protein TsaB